MRKTQAYKEITPLTEHDCFMIFIREKSTFNFPLHYHEEYELNFILNAAGAKRIVGDHVEEIDDMELVLVGPNVEHVWMDHHCKSKKITEVTIQFHAQLLDAKFLRRNQLSFIRSLFENASKGISFSRETVQSLKPRLLALPYKTGFDSVLELLSILHDLSISRNMRVLSSAPAESLNNYNSRRIEKAFEYMQQHFDKDIGLHELAKHVNMTPVSLSRFIKKRTGKTFIDSLNEIRIGHASRMLIDTTHSVSEICYQCGFMNLSNFNRIFKKKKGSTPSEFRRNFAGTRTFI
ncbi:AraC family transcriptional regulator [Chitinophaga sp. CB10]|uniref:AraC family transcriptional regulator n=1 Tax=Chitinophaga sp. CB10 TaxID=1891659 RepID=UPI000AC9CFCA|nr:AraC family transcriptional regulator [Chitinophaga sp. CB10]